MFGRATIRLGIGPHSSLYTVSQKCHCLPHYNSNINKSLWIIFGLNVTEKVRNKKVLYFSTCSASALPGEMQNISFFHSQMMYYCIASCWITLFSVCAAV